MSDPKDDELDADALLDSLSDDDLEEDPSTRRSEPKSMRGILPVGPKLHEPEIRQYPSDEVTVVGRSDVREAALEAVAAERAAKEAASEELAPDEVDELDLLLGAQVLPSSPTPASPQPAQPPPLPAPPPPPAVLPRPTPMARKQTLVGLQPNLATSPPTSSRTPTIPRPLPPIPRPGAEASKASGWSTPHARRALEPTAPSPPPPQATTVLDDEDNEATQVYDGAQIEAALLDLEEAKPLAPPIETNFDDATVVTAAEIGAEELDDDDPYDDGFEPAMVRDSAIFSDSEVVTSISPDGPPLGPVISEPAPPPPPPAPTPPPPPVRSAEPALEPPPVRSFHPSADERPAAEHLANAAQATVFAARAEWFEAEAKAKTDPQAKARLLLSASELWAMLGDTERARELASEALNANRTSQLAGRQGRWLAAAERDYKSVAGALEMEIRGSPTPEARVHAAYLSAEVHRLTLNDEATSKKKLELALRAQADDVRAPLFRLCEALGKSAAAPKFSWGDLPGFEALTAAAEQLVARRSPQAPAQDAAPAVLYVAARRMLQAGNRSAAAKLFELIGAVDGLRAAAGWLAAALLAHEPATRPDALRLLAPLASGRHPELARRALVARALEQGDASALTDAMRSDDPAFTAADRVALAALTGAPLEVVEKLVHELATQEGYAALAAAAHAAAGAEKPLAAGPSARAEVGLGRAVARMTPGTEGALALGPAVQTFDETHHGEALSALLLLELAVRARAAGSVAQALAEWPSADDDESVARDRELARALTLELGGEADAARAAYLDALEKDPACEAALRPVLSSLDADKMRAALSALAEASKDDSQGALYLLEALLLATPADQQQQSELLQRAVERDSALPLTYRIAERFARARGDADELSRWLRARRDSASDDVARALDLVREALLVAEVDLSRAAELLAEAIKARPGDVALRELFERLRPGADSERGEWRETAAAQAGERSKPILLLQAAFEFERAGDRAAAARAARSALEAGGGALASTMAQRTALGTPEAARVSNDLLALAKQAADAGEQRELYEQLSEFDRARGDASSAILWQSAILERSPEHLPALRRLEHAYLSSGRDDDLDPIALSLARLLNDAEGNAHARLSTRLRRKSGSSTLVREAAEIAARRTPTPLWSLRVLSAYARVADDLELSQFADQKLLELVEHPLDKATLSLRAAEAAARGGNLEHARALIEASLERSPEHLVALTTLAEVLEASGDFKGAAKALEAVAEASAVEAHKVGAWHQAGVLWLERAGEPQRGRLALEQVVLMDPTHEDAVLRLQAQYTADKDAKALAGLLERRLERATDPEERVALEVARSRALADVGEKEAAKAALVAALDQSPEHVEALEAFADLCASEGDWAAAEQAFIRLARHSVEPAKQITIYKKLGELYDGALPNPQRAELAYQEVLKRDPDDALAIERLIAVFGRLGQHDKAVDLATKTLERAASSDEKRDRTLALAVVYETIVGDRKKADAVLDKARKEWPHDAVVMRAVVEHHLRLGETRAVQVLLDRAASDARRALVTGRFEASFFEVLGTVAELRGSLDAGAVAQATLSALRGQPTLLNGAGIGAADPRLDELIAPDLLTPALRALLKKSGDLLDAAYPVDLRALRATPLPLDEYTEHVMQLAAGFGIRGLELYSSPTLGSQCLAASSTPPRIVLGQNLLTTSDDAARYFLVFRALKLVQAGATTLARLAPIELAARH